jgi:chromosome segregation ATPase
VRLQLEAKLNLAEDTAASRESRLAADLAARTAEADALRNQLASKDAACSDAAAQNTAVASELAASKAAQNELLQANQALNTKLHEQASTHELALNAAQEQLQRLETELAQKDEAWRIATAAQQTLETDKASLDKLVGELKAGNSDVVRSAQQQEAKLQKAQAQVSSLQQEVLAQRKAAEGNAGDSQAHVQQLQESLGRLQASCTTLEGEKVALQKQLGQLNMELQNAQRQHGTPRPGHCWKPGSGCAAGWQLYQADQPLKRRSASKRPARAGEAESSAAALRQQINTLQAAQAVRTDHVLCYCPAVPVSSLATGGITQQVAYLNRQPAWPCSSAVVMPVPTTKTLSSIQEQDKSSNTVQQERDKAKQELEQHQQQLGQCRTDIATLSADRDAALQAAEAARQRAADVDGTAQQLRSGIAARDAELASCQERVRALEGDSSDAARDLSDLEKQAQQLQEELDDAREQAQGAHAEGQALREQLRRVESLAGHRDTEVQGTQVALQEARQSLFATTNEAGAKQQRLDELEAQLEETRERGGAHKLSCCTI